MRVRAVLTVRTGATILHGKFDFDNRVASSIFDWRPTATGLVCRAGGRLLLPIDGKLLSREASAFPGLPMIILSAWPKEIDPIVLSTPHQFLGIHISGVHAMLLWEYLLSCQSLMNGRNGIIIGLRSRSGFNMGNHVGSVVITCFCHMHFVANPTRFPLLRIEGFGIIGRVDHCASRRSIGKIAPAQFSPFSIKILHPDPSQGLHRSKLAKPRRSGIGIDSIQQRRSIVAYDHCICFTSLLAIGKTIVFNAVCVPLDPLFLPLSFEPLRRRHRLAIQGGSKGFSYFLHAIERPHLRQHMGGVGALLSTCFEIAMFS